MAEIHREKITPPQLAKAWGISAEKVIALIKSGELAAIDVSTRQNVRPRFLIDRSAVEDFERRRAVVPVTDHSPTRKRLPEGVKEYF